MRGIARLASLTFQAERLSPMNFIVANWRNWWTWISQQCFIAIAAGHAAIAFAMSPEQQAALLMQHGTWISRVTLALAFLGFFGRFVNQTPPAGGMEQK
jgi:hypothetical protein